MSRTTIRQRFQLLTLAALCGCAGDLVLPTRSGEGVALSIVEGDGQTGTVGEELPRPLVVSVESGGAPAADHVVAFSIVAAPPGVRVDPDTALTGEDGYATAHVVLGPEMGAYEIEATLIVAEPQPPPSLVFEGSAVAGAPDTLRAASPQAQPGRRGQPVADPPTVVVLDRFGNPVAGAGVQWDVTAGGGAVSGGTTADTEGRATAAWTLGNGAGVQKLAARVEGAHGSPVIFNALVLF
jgi:hypothetical protein